MAFSVKNDRADELLRELMSLTGEGITEAVTRALDERLARARTVGRPTVSDMMWQLSEFRRAYPEVVGSGFTVDDLYDNDGLPK